MKTCKYCGGELYGTCKYVCNRCLHKVTTAKRFAEVRDNLRVKLGLPPLAETTSDENTCSIVD